MVYNQRDMVCMYINYVCLNKTELISMENQPKYILNNNFRL